jgi:hypothetical protein
MKLPTWIELQNYKLIHYYGEALGSSSAEDEPRTPEWELYDLNNDPYEKNNVYHEPNYSETVSRLEEVLRCLKDSVRDYE